MYPAKIYYEPEALNYESGRMLRKKYSNVEWIEIENHNSIPEFQNCPNAAFAELKRNLIVGVRKTHRYVPNRKTSDFLVPYTSSGCSAMCLYCYLVCNFNKCSYLRLFVNREEMLDKLIRTARKSERELTFEIGSNSDLVLENTLSQNLEWTIERFGRTDRGYITFPTKFSSVGPLLGLGHNGRVIVRMSVNPEEIVRRVEYGTAPLGERMRALNELCDAGYRVGLIIAPVVLFKGWEGMYARLVDELYEGLSRRVKEAMFIEIIFMTYSYVHRAINAEAFPNAPDLYDSGRMTGRGRGRYCYRQPVRDEAELFLRQTIHDRFPNTEIVYVV